MRKITWRARASVGVTPSTATDDMGRYWCTRRMRSKNSSLSDSISKEESATSGVDDALGFR